MTFKQFMLHLIEVARRNQDKMGREGNYAKALEYKGTIHALETLWLSINATFPKVWEVKEGYGD